MYITYREYCRRLFGRRMQKLAIDAGFSCPNRDGSLGSTGCTFCNNDAFNPDYCHARPSITQQIELGLAFHRRRNKGGGYLAYFQPYSNTHASIEVLRQRFEEALSHPLVEGLVIGTRPDCVDQAKLNYLSQLSQRCYVMVEYGIESCYDATLDSVARGHDFACTSEAIQATSALGIRCGGHLIVGLPGESREMILHEADILSQLPLDCLKLHQLQYLKGSVMGQHYLAHPEAYPAPYSLEEYVALMCDFRRRLRADIVVERYASEVPPRYQALPGKGWHHADGRPVKAWEVTRMVEQRLEE